MSVRYWLDIVSINSKSDRQRKSRLCLLWDALILGFSGTEKSQGAENGAWASWRQTSEAVVEIVKIKLPRQIPSSTSRGGQSRWETPPGGDDACIWTWKDGRVGRDSRTES